MIGTDPASGSRVTKGSTVALLTSLGRPTVPPIPAGGDVSALGAQLADRTLVAVDGGDTFSSKIPIGGVAALDRHREPKLPWAPRSRSSHPKGHRPWTFPM